MKRVQADSTNSFLRRLIIRIIKILLLFLTILAKRDTSCYFEVIASCACYGNITNLLRIYTHYIRIIY